MPTPSTALAPPTEPDKPAASTPATVEKTAVDFPMGITPGGATDGWRLAKMLSQSTLVPKAFFGKTNDIWVAVQMGAELGLKPMLALQSIAVINGRPSLWGDGLLALLMGDPRYQDHDEYFEVKGERRDGLVAADWKDLSTAAVCTFWRHGKNIPVTRRFTVAHAQKAGLLTKQGPWQEYPDRMLQMRARSFAGRDAFPDVLRGMRAAEELRDFPDAEPAPAPRVVQRLSSRAAAAPAEASAVIDAAPQPETAAADAPVTVTGLVVALDDLATGSFVTLSTGETIAVDDEAVIAQLAEVLNRDTAVHLRCIPGALNGDLVVCAVTRAD